MLEISRWHNKAVYTIPMETAAIIGLALFVASEIMPYLPIKSNGLAQAIIEALMTVFPKPEKK